MSKNTCYECHLNEVDDGYVLCPECWAKEEAIMKKAMDEWLGHEEEQCRKDMRIVKALTNLKGEDYREALGDLIEDLDRTSNYELVDKPTGKYQKEFWHKEIQGVWVDQRSVGMEGDSFEGYVYVKIKRKDKRDRYLKIPYSM